MPWARVARALSLVQNAPAAIEHNVGAPCAAVLGPEERELLPLSEAVLSKAEGPVG